MLYSVHVIVFTIRTHVKAALMYLPHPQLSGMILEKKTSEKALS